MAEPLYLLYLDRYHLGDGLFLQALARALGRGAPPCLLVHGSGEHTELLFEADGFFVEREGGVMPVSSSAEAALLERGLREINKKIVNVLTDSLVSAVGLHGADRGLLQLDKGGAVRAGEAAWLARLVGQGALPVVSALVREEEQYQVREASLGRVVVALAKALETKEVRVVFFVKQHRPGLLDGTAIVREINVAKLPGETVLPEPDAVREVVAAGVPVLLTDPGGMVEEGGPQGTMVAL